MTQQRHTSDDGSPGIDAQMRKALQHAPDARLEPPATLDEAILHAARRAASTPKHAAPFIQSAESQRLGARLQAWWKRPTAVPAVAVLVLATVVVSMWSRQPIPSAVEKSQPDMPKGNVQAGAAAAAAVAEAAPSPTSAAPVPDALARVLDVAGSLPPAPRPAPTPVPAPPTSHPTQASKRTRDEVVDPKARVPFERRQAAAAETTAPSEARASVRADVADAAAQEHREQTSSPAPMSPSVATVPSTPSTHAASAATSAPAAGTAPSLALNAQGAGTTTRPTDAARRMGAIEATPSDRLVQIVAKSTRWSWRQDRSQQNAAIDANTSQWLARLARITAGRWTRQPSMIEARSAASSTELWQLNELHATIILGNKTVEWIDRDGSTWRAVLTPDELIGLQR